MNIDWKAFSLKTGLVIVVTILVALVFAELVGMDGALIAVIALLVKSVDLPRPAGQRLLNTVGFTIVMLLVVTLGWFVGGEMWPVVIALTVVTFIGCLASAWGPQRAAEGMRASLLLVIVLPSIASNELFPVLLAVVLGALLTVVLDLISWAIERFQKLRAPTTLDAATDAPKEPAAVAEDSPKKPPKPELALRSPVTVYSVSKAIAVGLATLVGWLVVGGHPFWATFAPMMIIRPDAMETRTRGLGRVIGTILGGILGWALFTLIDNDAVLFGAFVLLGFLWFGSMPVNYAVSILFMTAFVVMSAALGGGVVQEFSVDRIAATILGVVIAFSVVGIQVRLIRRPEDLAGA